MRNKSLTITQLLRAFVLVLFIGLSVNEAQAGFLFKKKKKQENNREERCLRTFPNRKQTSFE